MLPSLARNRKWKEAERREIAETVESLRPWYYSFDFGDGLTTRQGQNPLGKFEKVLRFLPEDLAGATCLDCPSSNAQLLMLLKDRNAGRCVARDVDSGAIAQAKYLAALLGYDIDAEVASVYELESRPELDGGLDYVFCLGLLYHLTDMFGALKVLAKLTNKDCFIESEVLRIDDHDPSMARFIEGRYSSDGTNWWIPGIQCLMGMARVAGFATVEIVDYWEHNQKVTREGLRYQARGIFRATKGKALLAPRLVRTA